MRAKITEGIIHSAAVAFFLTASIKLATGATSANLLLELDPLLGLRYKWVLFACAAIELVMSAYLVLGRERGVKLVLILSWCCNLLIYRAALWWEGLPNLADSIGNYSTWFSISPRLIQGLNVALLGFLVVSSLAIPLCDWFARRTARPIAETA